MSYTDRFIKITVTAGQKRAAIKKIADNRYQISTKSPAKNNAANYEALETLAKYLKIPTKQLRIRGGHHHPNKLIEIID